MYIIFLHPLSLTSVSTALLTWASCDEGVDYGIVAKVSLATILVMACVVGLWQHLIATGSAWRSVVGFVVALAGMTCWINAVFIAVFLTMILGASGALEFGGPLGLALAVALVSIAAVECPPMRRTAWRDWREQSRWQRIGLLSGLGYLGLSLPLILVLLWAEMDKFNCY